MTRILIIEDDQRLADIIKRGLEEQGFQTRVAWDGKTGLQLFQTEDFDLVISDIILPEINGLEVCKKIRSLRPSLPVLMLTALGSTDDKVEGFDAGADDYLVKPFEFRELLARIKALMKRTGNTSTETGGILTYKDIEINILKKTVTRSGREIKLTPREYNLLNYMLQNPGRVLSRSEIAQNVWDTHFDTGTNFIDVYINYLRKKIDKPFDEKRIHTRSGMGFVLE